MKPDSLRGHAIYFDGQQFRYSDNHQSTIKTWKDRPCGHCGLNNTPGDMMVALVRYRVCQTHVVATELTKLLTSSILMIQRFGDTM